MTTQSLEALSDDALVSETRRVAEVERRSMADLLALLLEVERRGLHLALGYSSLFAYCTRALHLSEHAAYSRIAADRAARRYPALLESLADGSLTLSSVGLLAPHLDNENVGALIDSARHNSTRDVERLIACLYPQPDVPASLRALPVRSAESSRSRDLTTVRLPLSAEANAVNVTPQSVDSGSAPVPAPMAAARRPPVLAPLAPKRYLLKVTLGQETHDKLQHARALLRHVIPDGDPATILDQALSLLIERAERMKCATVSRPRTRTPSASSNRHVPAAVKREVWRRDGGCCAFVVPSGRCGESGFLEYHHVIPFAAGGRTDANNLQLRCRPHNARRRIGPSR